jgi:hypothetical protein
LGRRLLPFGAAVAVVALSLLVVLSPPSGQAPPSSAKGAPSAGLYRLRAGKVTLWDGAAPFVAGDAIRVEVAPAGLEHVYVLGASPKGELTTLYEGAAAPEGRALLPQSWTLDGARASETLDVIFSREPLDAAARERVARERVRDAGVWTTRWILTLSSLRVAP